MRAKAQFTDFIWLFKFDQGIHQVSDDRCTALRPHHVYSRSVMRKSVGRGSRPIGVCECLFYYYKRPLIFRMILVEHDEMMNRFDDIMQCTPLSPAFYFEF